MRRTVVALAAVVLLLAGCSPVDVVMTSISSDGQVVFVPCEEITGVQHISASIRDVDGDIWHARGEDGTFGPNRPVVYGITPEGFETDIGPGDFDPTSETFQFALVNTAVDQRLWVVDGTKLVEGKWLDGNGTLHDQPCG